MKEKIKLVKEKKSIVTSGIFIDVEIIDRLKEIKKETNIPISRIAEVFLRMALENYIVVDPEDTVGEK